MGCPAASPEVRLHRKGCWSHNARHAETCILCKWGLHLQVKFCTRGNCQERAHGRFDEQDDFEVGVLLAPSAEMNW